MADQPAPRRSVFAVWRWRWPRWVWLTLIPAIPVLYFLSMAPAYYSLSRAGLDNPDDIGCTVLYHAYWPARLLAENWSTAQEIHEWEYRLLRDTFGSPMLMMSW